MRNCIHENVWVNALFSEYKVIDTGLKNPYPKEQYPEHDEWNIWFSKQMPMWVITDLRFPNELKAIEDRKGITIRLQKSTDTNIGHESETALDTAKFSYVITNDGTIEELIEKVKEILIKEKII